MFVPRRVFNIRQLHLKKKFAEAEFATILADALGFSIILDRLRHSNLKCGFVLFVEGGSNAWP